MNNRAQAYVIGYLLILSLVVVSTSFIFVSVSGLTQDSLNSDQTITAERELTNLNSDITTPQFSQTNTITPFQVQTKQNMRFNAETQIQVTTIDADGNENTLLNENTMAPQYINPDTSTVVTYTMGGIWSTVREEPRVEPDMGANSDNIVINPVIISMVSDDAANVGAIESYDNSRERIYPTQTQSGEVSEGIVEITIRGTNREQIAEEFNTESATITSTEDETIVTFDTDDVDSYTLNINVHEVSLRT